MLPHVLTHDEMVADQLRLDARRQSAAEMRAYWDTDDREPYKRGIDDVTWHNMQPRHAPVYCVGDVVKFRAGGYGVIDDASMCGNNPPEYSTGNVNEGTADEWPQYGHGTLWQGKSAWHYEGDIEGLAITGGARAARGLSGPPATR